jgi:hypothetical protein
MSAFETVKNVQVGLSSLPALRWRKTWSRRAAALAFIGGGAASFGGCGSVAGPEYTGEVGLELRGEVVSFDGASDDRVPVLAFLGEGKVYLVDGDITGQFPSRFVFRVDEPPPADALRSVEDAPNGADVAVAFLAMASKDHPATMTLEEAFWPSTVADEAGDPDPETGVFTRTKKVCSDDGEQCQTKTYACKAEPCETLLVAGQAEGQGTVGSGFECVGDSCLTYVRSCDESTCSTTIAICEDGDPNDVVASDGAIDRCTLQNPQGQSPPISTLSGNFAVDLLVYFSTADFAKDGIELQQGYSLVQSVRAEENDWAESLLCRIDATDEVYGNAGDDTPEELRERITEAEKQCAEAQRWEVIDNPSERELTISLGDPTQLP